MCAVALAWVTVHILWGADIGVTVCLSRLLWGLPCPGCGLTRATLLLLHGDIPGALWMNPNVIIAFLIALSPVVFVVMLLRGRDPYKLWLRINETLSHKTFIIPFLTFELLVWIKNIFCLS